MKRDIKFRVWNTHEKKWETQIAHKKVLIAIDGTVFIGNIGVSYSGSSNVTPDRYIIQQYTGLKDKNGIEIYKGDIFKGSDYKWDAVEFENGKFIVNLRGARVYDLCELYDENWNIPTVIGNIFENEELLK